jgi:uncharacterized membrane protein YgaE (UPF0421/DUF939 family)
MRQLLRTWFAAKPDQRIGVSYALRTASAGALALLCYPRLGAQAGIWAVVSAVVVIQPDAQASVAAAALRVAANIVGATVGLVVGALLGNEQLLALVVGLLLVALLCRTLRLDAASRSASVSLCIVLLKEPSSVLGSSETRLLGVMAGCGIAFVVTLAAVQVERRLPSHRRDQR